MIRWTPSQRLAIETEGRDVLVAAGAGAGKTTVLVERILRKLRQKQIEDLDEVLVVTFTEKAARQMKARIYQALTDDPELRRHLPSLSRSRISTIHAFCARLLRENFLLANVEPGFHILDDHGRTEALEEALRQTFHRWYVRTDALGEEFGRLVELAGFDEQGESLRLLVRRLHEFARTTADPESYLDRLAIEDPPKDIWGIPWLPELEERLLRHWEQGRDLYEEAVGLLAAGGLKVAVQQEILTHLYGYPERAFLGPGSAEEFLVRLRSAGRLSSKGVLAMDWGRLPNGGGKLPGVQELHDTAKKLIDSVMKLLGTRSPDLIAEEGRRRRSLGVLVRLVREMDAIYEAYKRRGGWLDYSDLEVHAARILSGDIDLGVRFAEVLIDEYQDVNALQDRILSAVAEPGGSFRVGDVKQSIYGFRLADPTIFLGVLGQSLPLRGPAEVGSGSEPVAIYMNENYRSRPGVLEFVNDVFSRLFDARTIGSNYSEQSLTAGRGEEDAGERRDDAAMDPCVELHFIDIEVSKADASLPSAKQLALSDAWVDPTEIEPRYVARRLRALIGEGVLEDPEDGTVDWSRVAILLRSSTRAVLYADALRREGIPAELGNGGSLFEEPIVRDLRSVLRTIDNPRDDVAIAAAMRCPAFGFGTADLLRIRLAFPGARSFLDAVVAAAYGENDPIPAALFPPGEFERFGLPDPAWAEIVPAELRKRCRVMLDQLVSWRDEESWSELGGFVARVADAVHLVPMAFAGGDGSRQRACLERFFGLARSFESERGPFLHGFLARIDLLDDADAVDTVPGTRGEGKGVRILTVHKSKGLEFPVVVVPQLDWRVSTKDRLASRIRIDRDWVGLRWFDAETYTRRESVARQLLEWRQEEALREEEARILYVALTRAEERLLLFGMHRGLPKAESVPEGVWDYRRRHATTMLSWIVGALDWSRIEAMEPNLLRRLGLVPDPVPTYAELHDRLGIGAAELGADEMSASPPSGGEYRLGGVRVCRVSKVVLAAALAEADLSAVDSRSGGRVEPPDAEWKAGTETMRGQETGEGTFGPLPAGDNYRAGALGTKPLSDSSSPQAQQSEGGNASSGRPENVTTRSEVVREPEVGQSYDLFAGSSAPGASAEPSSPEHIETPHESTSRAGSAGTETPCGVTPTRSGPRSPDPESLTSLRASSDDSATDSGTPVTSSETPVTDADTSATDTGTPATDAGTPVASSETPVACADTSSTVSEEEASSMLTRVLVRQPIPPVARLTRLRGKYWVTEFKIETDFDRFGALSEEASAFWLDSESLGGDRASAPDPRDTDDASKNGSANRRGETVMNASANGNTDANGNGGAARNTNEAFVQPIERPSRAETGTLYHAWLSRVPIASLTPGRLHGLLAEEAERDPGWGRWRDPEVETGLTAFLQSEWGRRLVAAGNRVEREVSFSLKWSVEELRRFLPGLSQEIASQTDWSESEWSHELARHWVLLQGRLDCVFPLTSDGDAVTGSRPPSQPPRSAGVSSSGLAGARAHDGWVILDWKTDRVTADQVDARAVRYASQMALYRDAVKSLWGGPVTSVLVFLVPGEVRAVSE